MIHRVWTAVSLGAAVLAGCQSAHVARRPLPLAQRPLQVAQRPAAGDGRSRAPSKVGVGSIPTGADANKIRLAAADEDDLDNAAPLPPVFSAAEESASAPAPSALAIAPISLGLDDAIETGLVQNPDLVAIRQAEGVSEAALGVAQTYPFNPFVQMRTTPFQRNNEGGSGPTFHYVLLQQTLQLAHQQQFREDVACSQLNQVRWNVHNFELLNAAQTARLFLTALYQRGIRDLTRSSADLNQQLLRISESQVEAGQISKADVAIVRIDAQSTRQQADLAEANYQTALLDLRRQLNIPLDTPIELRGDLTDLHWVPAQSAALSQVGSAADGMQLKSGAAGQPDGDLIRRIADGRPDILAARADIETAYSNYRLANAMRTPDLMIGPFYQRDDFGTLFVGLQAQMDLPVNNTGKPLARQRAAEHQQRQVTWQQLQTRAELEAVAAVDRYERARRLIEASRPTHLGDLPAELQRLEQQFKENEVDVLRVFQGRTSLIQNRRAVLDMLNELAQATAAVTAATGIPPKALVAVAETTP